MLATVANWFQRNKVVAEQSTFSSDLIFIHAVLRKEGLVKSTPSEW